MAGKDTGVTGGGEGEKKEREGGARIG